MIMEEPRPTKRKTITIMPRWLRELGWPIEAGLAHELRARLHRFVRDMGRALAAGEA
jgi:hypothetical protein